MPWVRENAAPVAPQGKWVVEQPPVPAYAQPIPQTGTDGTPMPPLYDDMPSSPAPAQGGSTLANLAVSAQGAGRGVADLIGAPVDLATGAINLGSYAAERAVNAIPGVDGVDLPSIEGTPIGGSQNIADLGSMAAEAAGVPVVDPSTLSFDDKLAYNANRYGVNALATGSALRAPAMARAANPARKPAMFDGILAPYESGSVKPNIGDVAAGVGSGTALAAGQEYLPESMQGPLTDFVLSLLGGAGGATLSTAAASPKALVSSIDDMLPDSNVPMMPIVPATTFSDEVTMPVSRGATQRAARYTQENATNPAKVLAELPAKVQSYRDEGLPVPTTGTLSGDIGLGAVEQGDRVRNPVPYQVADQKIRTAASEQLASVAPEGADPRAATNYVGADVARRREEAAAAVELAQETTALKRQYSTDKTLADIAAAEADAERITREAREAADAAVAAAEQRAISASEGEKAIAAPFRTPPDKGAASRALDEVVVDQTMKPRQQAKNEKFASIPDAERDITPLRGAAAKVRESLGALNDPNSILPQGTLARIESLAPQKTEIPATPQTFKVDSQGVSERVAGAPAATVETGGKVSFQDMNKLRPELADAIRSARRAGNYTLADNLKALKREIGNEAERMASEGSPEAADALKYFKEEFAPYFGDGTLGGKLKDSINRDTDRVNTPPSATADRFLNVATGAKEAAADLRRILSIAPDQAAGNNAVRNYVIADLSKTVDTNGTIDPRRMREWYTKRRDTLSEFPELDAEMKKLISDVVNSRSKTNATAIELKAAIAEAKGNVATTKTQAKMTRDEIERRAKATDAEVQRAAKQEMKDALSSAKLTEDDIRHGNLSLLLDASPDVAVSKVFGSKDREKAMADVVKTLSADKNASAGWKKAVSDYMQKKLTGTNSEMTDGPDGPVQFAAAKKFFDENRGALSKVYSPKEMNALQKVDKLLAPFGALGRRATAGSPTAENNTQAWRTLEAGLKAYYGVLKGGGVFRTMKLAAATLPNSDAQVGFLVNKMQFDPDLAVHLMGLPLKDVGTPAWNSKLNRLLAYQEASRLEQPEAKTQDRK